MAEQEENVYMMGLGLFSTKERVRARFNTIYLGRDNALLWGKIRPTETDRDKYTAEYPAESARLDAMERQSSLSNRGTVLGTLAGTAFTLRWTRVVPVAAVGVYLSAVASHFVASDVSRWMSGTYKFDNGGAIAHYLGWVRDTQRPADGASPQLAA